MTLNVIEVS